MKVEISNPEDAFEHLQESDRQIRSVKSDGEQITSQALKATIDRNHQLFKKAKLLKEKK